MTYKLKTPGRTRKLVSLGTQLEPALVARWNTFVASKGITSKEALRRAVIDLILRDEIPGIKDYRVPDLFTDKEAAELDEKDAESVSNEPASSDGKTLYSKPEE